MAFVGFSRLCATSSSRFLGGGLACALFLIAMRPASAGELEEKQRAAKTACLSGDYARGSALLAELYVDTNQPMYIFNQGRCFEQNGRYEDAVNRFREYQRKNADAGNAPDPAAEKHIADCLSLLEIQKKAGPEPNQASPPAAATLPAAAPVAAAATPAAGSPVVPGSSAPAGASIQNNAPPAGEAPMSVQKKLGFAAMGLGVVGISVGVVSYFVSKSHLDKANSLGCSDSSCEGPARDEYNSAQSAITVCNVSSIAGGILAVGGLVLVLTAPSASAPSKNVAFVPVIGPGLAQVAMTGRF